MDTNFYTFSIDFPDYDDRMIVMAECFALALEYPCNWILI